MELLSLVMRSKLFVPGARPEIFEKAARSAADALSFDLEDAVAAEKKEQARTNIASFLQRSPEFPDKTMIVRVNAMTSRWFEDDVAAVVARGLHAVNVPKIESADDVHKAAEAIGRAENKNGLDQPVGILANIETPKALRNVAEIAVADRRVIGLQIGFKDLLSRWSIDSRDAVAQQFVRLQVRLAAGEGGIAAYDGAFAEVNQPEAFRAEAENARRMGFAGKTCIHPSQVPIANEVFTPNAAEIAHAEKVLAAAQNAAAQGVAVIALDGEMIDEPILMGARAVVALAAKLKPANP